jgi:predicted nucleic acid-binding protein
VRILLDINVALDLLTGRQPFVEAASKVFALVQGGKVEGYLSAHAVTTLDYVLSKDIGPQRSRMALSQLLTQIQVRVAAVDQSVIQQAWVSTFKDFEDGVTHSVAITIAADFIVTRNIKDFTDSVIPVLEPVLFLAHYTNIQP